MHPSGLPAGVPSLSHTVHRERITRCIADNSHRPVFLSSPSGWGKTTAAAEYASSVEQTVVWVDAGGVAEPVAEAVRELLLALRGSLPTQAEVDGLAGQPLPDLIDACLRAASEPTAPTRILLVVDDMRLESPSDALELTAAHRILRRIGVSILVTTQDSVGDGRGLCRIGPETLALSLDEVREIPDGAHDAVDLTEVWEASAGHPALTRVMLKVGIVAHSPRAGTELDQMIRQLAASVPGEDAIWLCLLGALGSGSESMAVLAGAANPRSLLLRLEDYMPLMRVTVAEDGACATFHVHDSARRVLADMLFERPHQTWPVSPEEVWDSAGAMGNWPLAMVVLGRYGQSGHWVRWLSRHAEHALSAGEVHLLDRIFDRVGLHALVEAPRLLLIWSRVASSLGAEESAVARAKAAAELALHERDHATALAAHMQWVESLKVLSRHEQALHVAQSLKRVTILSGCPLDAVKARAVVAGAFCNTGQLVEASQEMVLAVAEGSHGVVPTSDLIRLGAQAAMIRALSTGEYAAAIESLSRNAVAQSDWLSGRVESRGNLAVALLECGRIQRAVPLIRYVLSNGSEYQCSAFSALSAQLQCTEGAVLDVVGLFREAHRHSVACGAEYDLAVNRTYEAVCLRAAAQPVEALSAAERAFEVLSSLDFMGFRRLAALEIAASMLALGDTSSARRWTEPYECSDTECNAYHALRASMILAECDRREGSFSGAVKRIGRHVEHIQSESSNWQIAMYIRAFPGLLGVFAVTLGVSGLPAYMLRMLLPEHAERALMECRSVLEPEEWDLLGRKVLGDTAFEQLVRRDGAPVCRVRLFGGLDVSISGRSVAEREWRKRKARLMFAILVARQGKDLAREQLFDQLWPDLNEEKARNNFYVTWSAMKIALMGGPTQRGTACPYVENAGGRCRIAVEAVRSDIDEFEEAVAQAHAAEAAGDVSGAVAACTRLSTVYRGDLLPGDIYDDCFSEARERYRFEFVDSMVRVAELLLGAGEPCEAIVFARRALHADVLREDLYQLVLRCHIAAGQRSGAIDTFIQCRAKLSDELGLDPSSETMALYQEILVMEDAPRYDEYGLD